MPDPIPRNRSARGQQARRPARQRVWPGQLFQRPRGNAGPPTPPPPQLRPPATQDVSLGEFFRRPRGNVGPPEPAPPQPRPPARSRVRPGPPFRRSRGNVGPPGRHRSPTRTRPSAEVMVGGLTLAVAVLAVWIIVPLFPSETFSGSTGAPPVGGHANVATPGGNGPGLVRDQLASPGALAGPDPGPIPVSEARHNLTAVHRGGELPAAASQPGSAQPSQPSEPATVADLGRGVDPPATDRGQRPAPSPAEETPAPKPPESPAPPPVTPGPTPEEQRKQREKLAQFARALKAKADTGKQTPQPADQGPKAVVKKNDRKQLGTGGQPTAKVSDSKVATKRSSPSGPSSGPSGSSSSTSGSSSSTSGSTGSE